MDSIADFGHNLRLVLEPNPPSPDSAAHSERAPAPSRTASHQPGTTTSQQQQDTQQPAATTSQSTQKQLDEPRPALSPSSSTSSLSYVSRSSSREGPSARDSVSDPFNLDTEQQTKTNSPRAAALPPKLAVGTGPTTLTTDPSPPSHDSALPTYAALEEEDERSSNPRFGRWRGWIEKRAEETANIHAERREDARRSGGGWGEGGDWLGRAASERHSHAEKRMLHAGAVKAGIIPPLPTQGTSRPIPPPLPPRDPREAQPSPQRLSSPPTKHPLTASVSVEEVGSRFARHLSERPLCGITLPAGGKGSPKERFILVGTAAGLYLADLTPALSSGSLSLARDALSLEHAVVLPLWEGLGVHQLAVHVEHSAVLSPTPRGVVFALTKPSREDVGGQIKMWSLGALMNLAMWRVTNPTAEPLDLSPPPLARAGSILKPSASTREQKRTSTGGIIKNLITASSAFSPKSKHPAALGRDEDWVEVLGRQDSLRESGLNRSASSYVEAFDASRMKKLSFERPTGSVLGHGRTASGGSDHSRQSSNSAGSTEPAKSVQLEWATSFVPITLRTGHAPILFFKLCRAPPLATPPFLGDYEDDEPRMDPNEWLFLIVVTASNSVFVYESKPSKQRIWSIVNELYSPSTPTFVSLVRAPLAVVHASPPKRQSANFSSRRDSTNATDLALVVGISAGRAVLIRLGDLSVVELGLALEQAGTRSASPSKTTNAPGAPAVAGGAGIGFTFGRKAASVIARATSVASSMVENSGKLPAGMRGEDAKGLSKGVKLDSNSRPSTGAGLADEFGSVKVSKGEWVGCDEVRLPLFSNGAPRCLYLITKGAASHLALAPFGLAPDKSASITSSVSPSPGGMGGTPAPLLIEPIHSFTWPGPVTRVVLVVRPKNELVPELADMHRLVVLTGEHEHGVYVQEGTINLAVIESLFKPGASDGAVFTRTGARKTSPLRREAAASGGWDEERKEDTMDVNFGTRAVVLGEAVKEGGSSVYLAVEGRTEWQLHVLD